MICDVCLRLETLLSADARPPEAQDLNLRVVDAIANGSEFDMGELDGTVLIAASKQWMDRVSLWIKRHKMPRDFSTIHENLFENCLNVHDFVSDKSLYPVGERLLAYSLYLEMDQDLPALKEIEDICSNYMDLDLELTHEIWVVNLDDDAPLWYQDMKSLLERCKRIQTEESSSKYEALTPLNFDVEAGDVVKLVREYNKNQHMFNELRNKHMLLMEPIDSLNAYLLKYATYKSVKISMQNLLPGILSISKSMHDRIASFLFFESITEGAQGEKECILKIQIRLQMLGKRITIKARKQQARIKSMAAGDTHYSSSEDDSDPPMDIFDETDDLDAVHRSNSRLGRRGYKTLGYGTVRHTFRRRNTSRFQPRSSQGQENEANGPPLDDGY